MAANEEIKSASGATDGQDYKKEEFLAQMIKKIGLGEGGD